MVTHYVTNNTCQSLGRGITQSKKVAMKWLRKAAEKGLPDACVQMGSFMYTAKPYDREVGHVGEAAGVATPAGVMIEGHNVPPDVMFSVLHWYHKVEGFDPSALLDELRRRALEGDKYCYNDGCEVVGHLKVGRCWLTPG